MTHLAQATDVASNDGLTLDLLLVAGFGLAAILVFTAIYFQRRRLNVTFARLYGLIVVAVLAVGLAFTDAPGETTTAAFALLGTIAGYLAGARAHETTVTETEAPGTEEPTSEPPDTGADGGADHTNRPRPDVASTTFREPIL